MKCVLIKAIMLTATLVVFGSLVNGQTRRTGSVGVSRSASARSMNKGTLSLEAGLVYRSGDVKPVARARFFLVNQNPGIILQRGGLYTPSVGGIGGGSTDPSKLALAVGMALAYMDLELPEQQRFLLSALETLTPHIVESLQTDFSGKAEFSPHSTGSYYLMGVTKTPRGLSFWNVRIELRPGSNQIMLDQDNAATAF